MVIMTNTSSDQNAQNTNPEIAGAIEYTPEVASSEPIRSARMDLNQIGPVVVNQDGTLSRINNWSQMTETERANTMRVLNRRNQARMRALDQQQQLEIQRQLEFEATRSGSSEGADAVETSPVKSESSFLNR